MKTFQRLQITFSPSIDTFNSISDILLKTPTNNDRGLLSDKIPSTWTFEVIRENEAPYFDFINEFLDILENKYEKLLELGVQKNDITVWYLYEYDQQCNMEFDPLRLKRLGDNGITLCISCWDSEQI
jgi:hypothetical protein